jgi:RNase P subunit RPR2
MVKRQSETRTSSLDFQTTREQRFIRAQRFGRSFCPKCKDMLLAPMMSEYINEALVRHLWSCDECGHEFQASVRLTKVSRGRQGRTLS